MLVMTKEEEHAYNWAREQQFQSVAARYARALARYIERCRLQAVEPAQSVGGCGKWVHCSPELIASGVDCASTIRRPCGCGPVGSHDHWIDGQFQVEKAGD